MTSSNPRDAMDFNDAVRYSALTGWEVGSLVSPLLSIVFARRCGIRTVNAYLRNTWIGGTAGTTLGAAFGYAQNNGKVGTDTLKVQVQAMHYDSSRLRRNDYAQVGAFLGAALCPAIFWKSARAVNLILGGGTLGCAVGTATHLFQPVAPRNRDPVQIS